MFKFGRPNKLYDENFVRNFVQNNFVTGATYLTGLTMNYIMSADPAVINEFIPTLNIVDRYSRKIQNNNLYGTISHDNEKIVWNTRWDDEL